MLLTVLLIGAVILLAYSNGANDNFKGVATLYGSGTLSYAEALRLATAAQIVGSAASVLLAEALLQAFSGKGLVPPEVTQSMPFLSSVGLGASATVLLATVLGFPISTTHALTGALFGAAYVVNMGAVDTAVLGQSFVMPLLLSPVLAGLTAMPVYLSAHRFVARRGMTRETCLCVGPIAADAPQCVTGQAIAEPNVAFAAALVVGTTADCRRMQSYQGHLIGMSAQGLVDVLHYVSAFALCFARGLNDTPKIFALLFTLSLMGAETSLLLIALAMAVGGLLSARRVAEKMSREITTMNEGQALAANLVAAVYVILASKFGLPVSTTHVTVGAITGVGLVNGTARLGVIRNIVLAWILTLPVAAVIGATSMVVFG